MHIKLKGLALEHGNLETGKGKPKEPKPPIFLVTEHISISRDPY
jgi:hypothetical protein